MVIPDPKTFRKNLAGNFHPHIIFIMCHASNKAVEMVPLTLKHLHVGTTHTTLDLQDDLLFKLRINIPNIEWMILRYCTNITS